MKKIFALMFVLILAVPAISFAGSATSRWDMTIGGDVQADFAYSTTGAMALNLESLPQRNSQPGYDNLVNKYGNWVFGSGQTALNIGVRGPDAWGAKTSAYLSGDFTGAWAGSTYNSFDLMNANMTFDWGQESLIIGQQGSIVGMIPTYANNPDWGSVNFGGKGMPPVSPGIEYTQKFNKNFKVMLQVQAPQASTDSVNSLGKTGQNTQTMGPVPPLEASFVYESESCGKVGPWHLLVGLDGIYSKQKMVFTNSLAGQPTNYGSTNVDDWMVELKALVPIIPEHNGNKAHAWYIDAAGFEGQNLGGGYYGSFAGYGGLAYARPGTAANGQIGNYGSPLGYGWLTHSQFYITDQISLNGWYFHTYIKSSNWAAQNNPATTAVNYTVSPTNYTSTGPVSDVVDYVLNVQYDVNPAIKLVLQGSRIKANYAANNPANSSLGAVGYENYGVRSVVHLAAYYYF